MPPKTAKLVDHMRDAAAFVVELTRGMTEADYAANRMLRQTIERNFEIIGEAMRRLSHHDPATAQRISGHTQIIAFRGGDAGTPAVSPRASRWWRMLRPLEHTRAVDVAVRRRAPGRWRMLRPRGHTTTSATPPSCSPSPAQWEWGLGKGRPCPRLDHRPTSLRLPYSFCTLQPREIKPLRQEPWQP